MTTTKHATGNKKKMQQLMSNMEQGREILKWVEKF